MHGCYLPGNAFYLENIGMAVSECQCDSAISHAEGVERLVAMRSTPFPCTV